MPILSIRLRFDPNEFSKVDIGINLEKLDVDDNTASEELVANVIYYYTSYFVSSAAKAEIKSDLIAPDGFRIRFPGFAKGTVPTIAWAAVQANKGYFGSRSFYLENSDAEV